jgi:hypothetical protein
VRSKVGLAHFTPFAVQYRSARLDHSQPKPGFQFITYPVSLEIAKISQFMPDSQHGKPDPPENLRHVLQRAYERLQKPELVIFCSLRSLKNTGSPSQLAKRLAEHDLTAYQPSALLLRPDTPELRSISAINTELDRRQATRIPMELVVLIIDHIGDWELSQAVGITTSLARPREWSRATELDLAVVTRSLERVQRTSGPFYTVSAKAAIRFSCIEIIEYLFTKHRANFDKIFGQLLPLNACLEGSISVLNWYKANYVHIRGYDSASMDNASLNGHVHILQWWFDSGLTLKYSEAALEHASARGHVAVLDWWKNSKLPLKIGRVMELASGAGHIAVLSWWVQSRLDFKYDRVSMYNASCSGRLDSLEWWAHSGLHMIYDPDVLVGATRHNKPEALEWWDKSGLPIQYRLCDIEEALEDSLGGGSQVRAWWENKGVDFKANFTEWTKYHSLH